MTNIAMKGIFYRTIDMLKYIGYSEELLDWIYSKIRIFDDDTMMINAYKWEHYLFSHLYMSTDTFLQKLYIPLLLDGEESIKIAKNYYSFYMQMIDTSLPNGKYSNNDIDNPFANKDIFENTDYDSYTIHNIFWKYLLRSFIPSLNSYYKRFLFSEIEKNTILYPIIY